MNIQHLRSVISAALQSHRTLRVAALLSHRPLFSAALQSHRTIHVAAPLSHRPIRSVISVAILSQLLLLPLASCSNDDSPSDNEAPAAVPYQVTLVFEPGELGDNSTNDLLLGEFTDFASSHKDRVATQFISLPTTAATAQAVKDWCSSSYDSTPYEHRLLILSTPALASMLRSLQLRPTDHVLLLSTPLADAKKVGPAGHTHVMNISLADGVNRFLDRVYRYYCQFYDLFDPSEIHDGPFRIYHLNDVSYADSVSEAVHKRFPTMADGEEGIYEVNMNTADAPITDTHDAAYLLASSLFDADGNIDGFTDNGIWQSAAIVSLGTANQSFDYFFFSHRKSIGNLIVGEPTNVDSRCDFVSPHYPLKAWLESWTSAPDAQPEQVWHGSWDGCAIFTPGLGL